MHTISWEQFQWVRSGESGSNREGFGEDIFEGMCTHEKDEACELLVEDFRNSKPFSIQGITFIKKEDTLEFIQQNNITLNLFSLTTVFGELFRLTGKPHYFEELIGALDVNDSRQISHAAYYLEINKTKLSDDMIQQLKALIPNVSDGEIRYRLSLICFSAISGVHTTYPNVAVKKAIEIEEAENREEIISHLESLIDLANE